MSSLYEAFPLLKLQKDTDDSSRPPLIYLDNAATTHKPKVVFEAIENYYKIHNANPYRGAYRASVQATYLYESARSFVASFIGAAPDEVVFTRNTTEALNLVAYSYALENLHKGDQIVLPISEHHSNLVVWQYVCRVTGAELVYLYPDAKGRLLDEEIEKKIGPKTKLLTFAHISNVLGTINPARFIIEKAHAVNAVVVMDCAQSVAHRTLNVKELDADFIAFSGHKMYAPMGIGVLYGKAELLASMQPFLFGGEMIDLVQKDHATFEEGPKRFEAGTPNIEGALGLATAIDYLQTIGFETIDVIERSLTQRVLEGLRDMDMVTVYGNPSVAEDRCGVVSFNVKGAYPQDVALMLDEENIAIRSGTHCAQPLHQWLGIEASCRVSPCFYNSTEEIDRFLEVLSHARRNISKRIMSVFP